MFSDSRVPLIDFFPRNQTNPRFHLRRTYADHWCWYGCNKSGKWGCFPQSHIMPNTLADLPPRLNHHDSSSNLTGPSDAASTHSSGHASSKAGLFQKMSMRRHRSGEPDIPRVPTLSPRLQ